MYNFIGLDGKKYQLDNRPASYPLRSEAACKSKLQYRCGQILKNYLGMAPILEEVPIPGHNFIIDFFMPTLGIALEVHGEQHDKYVPYFHKSKANFIASKNRDENKKTWCEINKISFYEIRSEKELRSLLGIIDESLES